MTIFGKTSVIRKCFFDFNCLNYNLDTSNWFINSYLKYLHVNDVTWQILFRILSFTPRVYSLKAVINESSIDEHEDFTLLQLRKLNISIQNLPFSQLKIFKQVVLYLECFQLRGIFKTTQTNYFNEKLWEKLLCDIKYYDVKVGTWEYGEGLPNLLKQYIDDFQSKKWFFLGTKSIIC
ncbi:hypothetical protein I4U23_001555 [Adineta vaga]|nr:hypothetical protein I4U23_001555 [Adineta vaga]